MTEANGVSGSSIVCLGWGSLVWDGRNLPVAGVWQVDGPSLPLEFARQSSDGRMTLVIVDGDHRSPALWCELDVGSLDEAVQSLADREGVARLASIGRWPDANGRRYPYAEAIADWAEEKGISAVVWTALKPGMKGRRGDVPSLEEAKAHLVALAPDAAALASEYLLRAPAQIATPHREVLCDIFKGPPKGTS